MLEGEPVRNVRNTSADRSKVQLQHASAEGVSNPFRRSAMNILTSNKSLGPHVVLELERVALVLVEEPTSLNTNDVTPGVPMYPLAAKWLSKTAFIIRHCKNAPASLP